MPEHGNRCVARLVLFVSAACALVAPCVHADILVHDRGDEGLAFTNVQSTRSPRAAQAQPARNREAARKEIAPLVAAAAKAHGLPEELILAVIEVESRFNPQALSPKGAVGLMQLMPATALELGVADARPPEANIDAGARYLKAMLGRFGNDIHLALAAYNAGPGAVSKSGAIPPYPETQRYVPEVIRRYHRLQSGAR